jgi:hypothetical protein
MQVWETDPELKSVMAHIMRTKGMKLCPARMMTVEDNFLGLVPAYLCLMQVLGHSIPADEKVKRCLRRVLRAGLLRQATPDL